MIKDKERKLCCENDHIMDRWTEYIDLFSDERDDGIIRRYRTAGKHG